MDCHVSHCTDGTSHHNRGQLGYLESPQQVELGLLPAVRSRGKHIELKGSSLCSHCTEKEEKGVVSKYYGCFTRMSCVFGTKEQEAQLEA